MADSQARRPLTRILLKISGEALLGAADYGIDPAILKRIAGEIHFAHPSPAEQPRDLEAADRIRHDAARPRRLRRLRRGRRGLDEETFGRRDVAAQGIAGEVVLQQRLDFGAERLGHLPADVVILALLGGQVSDLTKQRRNVGSHTSGETKALL